MNLYRNLSPVILVLAVASLVDAAEGDCRARCPRCNVVCVPSKEMKSDKKTAFEVESKWICVPRVRFPWESNCKPRCAWVRKVHVLKKLEYECERCQFKWTATCACDSCANEDGRLPPSGDVLLPPVPRATGAAEREPAQPDSANKTALQRFFEILRR